MVSQRKDGKASVGDAPFKLVIQEKNGPRRSEDFAKNEVTIGRVQGNDIVLPKGNISKRHSRIVLRDGKFIIVDLRSTNGTYVNGKRINAPQVLKDNDKVYIGDFTLTLEPEEGAAIEEPPKAEPPPPAPEPPAEPAAEAMEEHFEIEEPDDPIGIQDKDLGLDIDEPVGADVEPPARVEPPVADPPVTPPRKQRPTPQVPEGELYPNLPEKALLNARATVFDAVLRAMTQAGHVKDDEESRSRVTNATSRTLAAAHKKVQNIPESWEQEIVEEVCGLGAITTLIDDATVSEIFVNGPHQIIVKGSRGLSVADTWFSSSEAVAHVVRRIMEKSGVPFDEAHPVAEVRISDGTRVNAVHQSVAVNGPLVTITRTSMRESSLGDLVTQDVLSQNMAKFLTTCVRTRQNILVCGGAGAGVGTMVGALGAEIEERERIVTVQQVARLKLPQPLVVTLEPRPSAEGCAADMRTLVGNALRMRPERLVVHEVAGPEALDLIIALGGGQDGSIISCYGHSSRDALSRLETMVRLGGQEAPGHAVRDQISNAVTVVVEMCRFADGSSRVVSIAEVLSTEVDIITTSDIFSYQGNDGDGQFVSGSPPRFFDALIKRGEQVDKAMFRD